MTEQHSLHNTDAPFPKWLLWTMAFGLLGFYLLQLKNGKFELHDFRVYYGAADAWLNGKQVYEVQFGLSSGVYKYAPTALIPFAPFALLPYKIAASVFYFLIAGGIMTCLSYIYNLYRRHLPNTINNRVGLSLFVVLIFCATHLLRELELGNINMLLLLLFLAALKFIITQKYWYAGLLIGLGIVLKPHFIVLLPLLFLRKQHKTLLISLLGVLLVALIPFIFTGISEGQLLYADWFTAMSAHNADLVYLQGPEKQSANTLYTIIYNGFAQVFLQKPATWFNMLLLASVAGGILWYILYNAKQQFDTQKTFIIEYCLVLAIIPLITVTDTEHFLLSLPFVIVLIFLMFKGMKPINVAISVLILLMYGGNWHDLLGKSLSVWVSANGILGWGNLCLIIWTLVLLNTLLKKPHYVD